MSALPSGTVTFLFTDIEGSTRLWEQHSEAMRVALRQHDDLLRACIESHGGAVFKTVGDAFCAAFADPRRSVEAVMAAQQWLPALRLQVGEGTIPLRVRMALHTGVATERDADYFGPPVNRVARLLSIGHGGQILLSAATQELVRDDLPKAAYLRELGSHRLRDLQRPEQVFQLAHPELSLEFPALRSLASFPNNLPQQATSFVGRERELAEAEELLNRTRLLTLAGAGGTGKTRLALQLAAEVLPNYADGVWLVELAGLVDGDLVPQTIASVLSIQLEGRRDATQAVVEELSKREIVLILDNCEHVLESVAQLEGELLRACPNVRVVCTSRELLNVAGEVVFRVPSMGMPSHQREHTLEALGQFEAVRLFIDRAQAVLPSFRVTSDNAPAVAEICWRLDGIPLALELAAARVKLLRPEQLLERLNDRFRLLTGGSRTAVRRQQTLRALIDWSYELLSPPERTLLQRLSVFAGGWDLEAAEAICSEGGIEEWELLETFGSLADKSLIQVSDDVSTEARYRLLETVREYARERLEEAGQNEAAGRCHRDYFLALAETAAPHLTGPEQKTWFDRLERELDNLRSALDWSRRQSDEMEAGLRLACALRRFWEARGLATEGRALLAKALSQADSLTGSPLHAQAVEVAGMLAWVQGDVEQAQRFLETSLREWSELGRDREIATALNNLGLVAHDRGDLVTARDYYQRSLDLRRALQDESGIAASLGNLGCVAEEEKDFEAAQQRYAEALEINRKLGNRRWEALAQTNLALVRLLQEHPEEAREDAVSAFRLNLELGERSQMPLCFLVLAMLALGENRPQRSLSLLGASEAMRGAFGIGATAYDRELLNTTRQRAAALLSERQLQAAWDEGQRMDWEAAVSFALSQLDPPAQP